MADETEEPRPIIVIKKITKVEGGHGGSAWKVAYADFVTAMMAFFLLLWLLNATTEEQKRGIAEYFAPASVARGKGAAGGLFGGVTLTKEGRLRNAGGPAEGGMTTPLPAETRREPPDEIAEREDENLREALAEGAGDEAVVGSNSIAEEIARREEASFADAAQNLRQALQQTPELVELQNNVVIDETPEGLRIQLVDREGLSMFAVGSAEPMEHTKRLKQLVVDAISSMPNKIAISGHTDSTPYRGDGDYSNWELSADRANAARRQLIDGGLSPARTVSVEGKADTDLLVADNPTSPRNRRVTIVLLREANSTGPIAATIPEGDRFEAAPPGSLRAPTTQFRQPDRD